MPHLKRPRSADVVRSGFFVVLVLLASALGQLTFYGPAQISLVWPLSGVALVWLLLTQPAALPREVTLLALSSGVSILLGVGGWDRAALSTILAVVPTLCMVWIMRRWCHNGRHARHLVAGLNDLVPFSAAVVAGGVVAGALRGWGLGLLPPTDLSNALLTAIRTSTWSFVIGAVGLSWVAHLGREADRHATTSRTLGRMVELLLVAVVTSFELWWIFDSTDPLPVLFPTFLTVVWASLRIPSTAIAVLASSALGVVGILFTLRGQGPFAAVADPRSGAILAQSYMVCLAVVALLLSTALADRATAVRDAQRSAAVAKGRAELLDAVVGSIEEGILVVQDDGEVLLTNTATGRLFRAPHDPASTDPADHASPYRLWRHDGSAVLPADLPSRLVLDGTAYLSQDFDVRQGENVVRVVEVAATKLPDAPQEQRKAIVTFRDVSDERKERTELQAFAGVVAHDLANPLTVITGWAEALIHTAEESGTMTAAEVTSMARRIMASSTHMHAFISDLLGYTLAHDQPLRNETVDLSALCRTVAELRTGDVDSQQVSVEPGMIVCGDLLLLRQLMDNLVGNALKYVAPGVEPRVVISLVSDSGHATVSVSDNGIGIPAADRHHVFGNFFRVQSAAGSYKGTGLGLAICQRVVQRHHGDIWVANPAGEDEVQTPGDPRPLVLPDDGRGTRISFTLPHAPADAAV